MVVISWFINQHSHHWGAPSCMTVCLLGLSGSSYGPSGSSQWTFLYIFGVSNYVFISMGISGTDWLEVPTIYVREYPHKIWPDKWYIQYLHFRIIRILEFPLIHMLTADASIDGVDDCCRRRWCVLHVEEVPKPHDWGPLRGCFSQVRRP